MSARDRRGISLSANAHAELARKHEPVTVGVPLPQGVWTPDVKWQLLDVTRSVEIPCQTENLAQWPDGSVKWLSLSFLTTIAANETARFEIRPAGSRPGEVDFRSRLTFRESDGELAVDTDAFRFFMPKRGEWELSDFQADSLRDCQPSLLRFKCVDAKDRIRAAEVQTLAVQSAGPVRIDVVFVGKFRKCRGLRIAGRLSFFAGTGLVRAEVTLQNPGRARHKDGYWDLGDPGSTYLRGAWFELDLQAARNTTIEWIEQPLADRLSADTGNFRIHQESSGGENWNSRNHLDRHSIVPLQIRGYQTHLDRAIRTGQRASPVVCISSEVGSVACALEEFWQKFPSAIEVDENNLRVSFWPLSNALHELQAGEHCTRVAWFRFDRNRQQPRQALAWVHEPVLITVDPQSIAESEAVCWFPQPDAPERPALREVLAGALDSDRSFFAKREVIDEYGWRNYGDVWADHEEAYCDDPPPVISHYNNQYDLLHGLLIQYLQSGDARWWQLADPLARHIMDVDIYHTDRDKPAYNGGLFWHTAHYHDAGTSTHRSMSRTMRGKAMPAPGGGPANEHNYSTGLLLYHYLTGCRRARRAVIGLADWVIAMDDGRQHVLGIFSDHPTGDASRTALAGYHGPGRGAGNSINALVDGWLVSDDEKHLVKAIELIRRTIHPKDDLRSRGLGNAELRWSYTVHLQALMRFCEATARRDGLHDVHRYIRAAVLHYARWMAEHERFYLDHPEELEFPTETWAAQELRKGNVLLMAASLSDGAEREKFARRGREILDRAWQSLVSFDTRQCTRPLALVLQQSYLERYFASPNAARWRIVPDAKNGTHDGGWGDPLPLVSQKAAIRRAFRSPRAIAGRLLLAIQPRRWKCAVRQTWFGEHIRRCIERF